MASKPILSTSSRAFQAQIRDIPGEFAWIDKTRLRIDPDYQRTANENKIRRIVVKWSWLACSTIIVARRQDGDLYVVDGGHRFIAALRRTDIDELPCLIFDVDDVVGEAQGFIAINTDRKPISSFDKYHAMLAAKDQTAIWAQYLLDSEGYSVTNSHGSFSEGTCRMVRCIDAVLFCCRTNWDVMQDIWPLVVEIHHGRMIHQRVLKAIFIVECRLRSRKTGQTLLSKTWSRRIRDLGAEEIIALTNRAMIYHQRGGEVIWARALVDEINKGMRKQYRISWDSTRDED